jgi:hypothetical protein
LRTTCRRRRKFGLELASATSATTGASAAGRSTPLTTKFLTTMFAARCASSPIPVEPVRVQIVSFEVAIDSFAAGTCGAATRRGFHDDEWRLVFLRYLRRREPGLLQRGILAEQRFLQRPSHTVSLVTLKFLAPPVRPSTSAASARALPA